MDDGHEEEKFILTVMNLWNSQKTVEVESLNIIQGCDKQIVGWRGVLAYLGRQESRDVAI